MDEERLSISPIGTLVPIKGQDARHGDFASFAFLPSPLPEDVTLSSQTWTAVATAATALGRLDQACTQLPDPKLLIRPALYREALDTSALEGTVAPLQDLLEAQLLGSQYMSPQAQEVNAYVEVATQAFETARTRPITVALLAEYQAALFATSPHHPRQVGRVRDEQVWIGPDGGSIYEARFVPPPGDDRLRSGLEAWETWIHNKSSHLHPVLRAALAHYQFEALHPFYDGNGRLGRLVVVLQLLGSGTLREPAITLSPWLLKHRSDYQNHMLEVSCTGNWNPWIEFFCEAVCQQAQSLKAGAVALRDWLENSRSVIYERGWSGRIHRLLEDLVEWPLITVSTAADRYDTTPGNATKMIDHLTEVEILSELTGKTYGRVFGARGVMEIVESI